MKDAAAPSDMQLFANVDDRIDAHTYPATAEELIAEYGHLELAYPNGAETFADALGRLGETTFQGAEDARLATYSAVAEGAVGRQGYSDRDAPSINEDGPEQLSF